jgi:transposase-like protein
MTQDDDARVADLLARSGDRTARSCSAARSNQRNGSRSRLLSTPAGDVELRIPKVRVWSFIPSLLERRRRVDRPCEA